MSDRYLSVVQVAELLGTTVRFPRRLVAERRIRYVKVGTHVRIPESAVEEYIAANTVEPVRPRARRSRFGRAA
ncbi:excisionase family DNA-binding protein [Streptomyces sp. NPDC127114]|uniref:excisionase family DNA-binding protein n=1 Tax=Streptomyces sp. NPDC127114 TaxID=3345366 RepID=UPI0036290031